MQAKLDDLDDLTSTEHERLISQVRDMRDLTRSPKVMVAPLVNGIREPRMHGNRIFEGARPQGQSLADYVVARITPTLDGDTRPTFVEAVQEGTLAKLRVHAEMSGPRRFGAGKIGLAGKWMAGLHFNNAPSATRSGQRRRRPHTAFYTAVLFITPDCPQQVPEANFE